ncbi:heme-binding protein [Herbaspirillum sp. VT-16-41]|uniref:GlcG/HbpS family heme-binding protein n=1 Tax=Herbaspirillum sp. VT-16-41 TaxID=1953765 RepID=UPI00098252DC|nr:heme-binding protein [Herbaspirillum sp. VT-16-41]ONN64901.1 GlcG protein [Herbaspirillum sp. VT-16-41]
MSQLTLAQAKQIIAAALADARERNTKPMGVVVLDAGGHLKAAEREDGATMFRIDIAQGKAWAAVAMGVNSRNLVKRAADNPSFFAALSTTGQGKFIPQVGAVLIVDEAGAVIGAVGASGDTGDQDEAICIEGVKATGLKIAA